MKRRLRALARLTHLLRQSPHLQVQILKNFFLIRFLRRELRNNLLVLCFQRNQALASRPQLLLQRQDLQGCFGGIVSGRNSV